VSSLGWLATSATSAVSGAVGVVGVLLGSLLTARREDKQQAREAEREQDRWSREDDRRWVAERRRVYIQYLEAVKPWIQNARRWRDPWFPDGDAPTKERIAAEAGHFDYLAASDELSQIEAEIALIGSDDITGATRWLRAQLLAFEATRIASGLDKIEVMSRNCEPAYDRLLWAMRTDLGVTTPEPRVKPPPSNLRKAVANTEKELTG
jgi:hypothetical protein